ncbi:MAG: flagellar motor protein MotB [Rhodospirillales bacterium]|nr:flagellar motor protein MotB [Rhodospirillales bacterium]
MSGQLLGLSLFIMLLAFFIVLNAISSYEETKIKPVMESLGYTFSSRMEAANIEDHPSMREDDDTSINEGDTVDRIKALFTAQIPSHEAVVSHTKGVMYMRLPFEDFEAAVMAVGQRNALDQKQESAKFLSGFFLPTLVALMKTDTVSAPYRMDILLNIEENPAQLQNQQPKKLSAVMKQMSRLAAKIEDAGLSTKLISTGLQKGRPGMVELLFRPHVPFNPLEGTLEDEANE